MGLLPMTFTYLPFHPTPSFLLLLKPSSLLRLLLMKSSSSTSPPPLSFSSPSSLSDYLRPHIPSLPTWGITPGTKPLHNLFLELSNGESYLIPSLPPIRTLAVATLNIKNPTTGAFLLESHQLLSDGTIRVRNRPLSEKMKPGETVEAAAVRAVREELGEGVKAKVKEGSWEVKEEERESVSYPGLVARYLLHSVEAEVEGVPDNGEFSTEEEGPEVDEGGVFVRKHFWKWVLRHS